MDLDYLKFHLGVILSESKENLSLYEKGGKRDFELFCCEFRRFSDLRHIHDQLFREEGLETFGEKVQFLFWFHRADLVTNERFLDTGHFEERLALIRASGDAFLEEFTQSQKQAALVFRYQGLIAAEPLVRELANFLAVQADLSRLKEAFGEKI